MAVSSGGELSKVNWEKSYSDYSSDENYKQKIVSYEDKGETNKQGDPLIHFTFENGKTSRYVVDWIYIEAEFELHSKYKKDTETVVECWNCKVDVPKRKDQEIATCDVCGSDN